MYLIRWFGIYYYMEWTYTSFSNLIFFSFERLDSGGYIWRIHKEDQEDLKSRQGPNILAF